MEENNVFDNKEPNTKQMTFEETKRFLRMCTRIESRDHAFSDREVFWRMGEVDVADGYFGGGTAEVVIHGDFGGGIYLGEQALELASLGNDVIIGRNDETGPDYYGGI